MVERRVARVIVPTGFDKDVTVDGLIRRIASMWRASIGSLIEVFPSARVLRHGDDTSVLA
jgi:hypothetical protein